MIEVTKMMHGESKEYYLKAFENFSSEETYNKYIYGKTESEIKETIRKVSSDAKSFWFNQLVIPLHNRKEEIRKNIQLRNFK